MSTVLPLVCWPHPVPVVVLDAIREAKEALCRRDGLDFKVQLFEGVPGTPFRVLSFKGPPPFACDAAKLRNWQDPAELQHWIEWVLDGSLPVEEGFTVADWVSWVIPGAKEVTTIYSDMELERDREDAELRGIKLDY